MHGLAMAAWTVLMSLSNNQERAIPSERVRDQLEDWNSGWFRIYYAGSRSASEVEELLNKDWAKVGISTDEKKGLRNGLAPYVKAAKATSKRRANCLVRIERTWSVADRNRFSRLHYPRSSETFFRYFTTVVKLAPNCQSSAKGDKKIKQHHHRPAHYTKPAKYC